MTRKRRSPIRHVRLLVGSANGNLFGNFRPLEVRRRKVRHHVMRHQRGLLFRQEEASSRPCRVPARHRRVPKFQFHQVQHDLLFRPKHTPSIKEVRRVNYSGFPRIDGRSEIAVFQFQFRFRLRVEARRRRKGHFRPERRGFLKLRTPPRARLELAAMTVFRTI